MAVIPDINEMMAYRRHPVKVASRASGFYWIKLKGHRWVIAEWLGEAWLVPRISEQVQDDLVAEIIERRLMTPDEALLPEYMGAPLSPMPPQIKNALDKLETAMGGRA